MFFKTKELVFRRPSDRHFTASQPLPFIEQVTVTKLLGVYIYCNPFTATHVAYVALHIIFTAVVLSAVTYALRSMLDTCQKNQARLDSLFQKAFRRGSCFYTFSMEELMSAADKKLCRQMTSIRHCLHSLLPKLRHTKAINFRRSLGHNYQLPQIKFDLFKN